MSIERRIPSKIDTVPAVIADILIELTKDVPLSAQDRFDLNVLLEEAVTNAIKHGNKHDSARHVTITLNIEGKTLILHVKDEGRGFDHAQVPALAERNEQMRSSGRGIALMRQMSDELTYNAVGNELCIRKKIH